jgi:hypothetical protein
LLVTRARLANFFFAAGLVAIFEFPHAIALSGGLFILIDVLGPATGFTGRLVGCRVAPLILDAAFHALHQRFAFGLLK